MQDRRTPLYRFLAPRFWPTWMGLGLLRAAVILPYSWQLFLGRQLGDILFRLAKDRRAVAAANLALCFPEIDEEERRRLLREHFRSLGIGIFEIGLCWWASDRRLRDLVSIHGLDRLQAATRGGRGAILLSAHFTTLEVGGRLLGLHHPFHLMYRPHRNPLYEEILRRRREHHFERAIPRDNVRELLRSLKTGHVVWYAPDQAWDRKSGALVPFFGEPAHTNTATSRLAATSGAPVLPFHQIRREDGSGYDLYIGEPIEDFPSGSPEADATRTNRIFERMIRQAPEQYLWVHRRFKRRPPEYDEIY